MVEVTNVVHVSSQKYFSMKNKTNNLPNIRLVDKTSTTWPSLGFVKTSNTILQLVLHNVC